MSDDQALPGGLDHSVGHLVEPVDLQDSLYLRQQSVAETRKRIEEFQAIAIRAAAIARAIRFAIEQPDNVDVSEMIVQPTGEQ